VSFWYSAIVTFATGWRAASSTLPWSAYDAALACGEGADDAAISD
jgi:hypothetical protein